MLLLKKKTIFYVRSHSILYAHLKNNYILFIYGSPEPQLVADRSSINSFRLYYMDLLFKSQ